jgi:hypothetical protein
MMPPRTYIRYFEKQRDRDNKITSAIVYGYVAFCILVVGLTVVAAIGQVSGWAIINCLKLALG